MNALAAVKASFLASVFGVAISFASVSVFADDAADTVVAANVAKTTALAPLPKIIPVPLPPNSASNQPNATVAPAAPSAIDAGNGELLTLPTLNAPVIDQANVLSAADNQQLSDQLRAIHNAGRAQIGLVLVKSTQGESIFDYAGRVFTAWKLGDAKRDNGLLIVVATQDRKIQILTGYGLEGIIPDIIASRIIREQITPQFKTGQYAAGLKAGIDRIDSILQEDPETARAAADQLKNQQQIQDGAVSGNFILLLIVLVVIGQFTQMIFGRVLSSTGLAAAGIGVGLFTGAGLATSLLLGGVVFVMLLVGILPFLSMFGNFGGGRGGGFGGGYSGGGGSFGGGGASGSW